MEKETTKAFATPYKYIIDIDDLYYIHKWDMEKEGYVIFDKTGYDIITANQIVEQLNKGEQSHIVDLYVDLE